jgi:precorrin-8X/cobalt-precorrin-8 methylmutase
VTRTIPPIEAESYRILRSLADTSALPPLTLAVVERLIHTSADPGYLGDVVADEAALAAGQAALAAGAPLVTDVTMVAAGVSRLHFTGRAICKVGDADTAALAADDGITRAAAGVRLAFGEVGPHAVWAVGNAPTALTEIIALDARPALVIGFPVGFVGAAESKAALRASGLPQVSNRSSKGGSPLAAAVVNALLYTTEDQGISQ